MWLGYQHNLIGKNAFQAKTIFELIQLATGLPKDTITKIYNLTSVNINAWGLFNIAENLEIFRLKNEQPFYLSLVYITTNSLSLEFDLNKTTENYLQGVTFFSFEVTMDHQLRINPFASRNQVLGSIYADLSSTYFSVTHEQFTAIHSLSAEDLIKLGNRTVNNTIEIGAVLESSTIDQLIRLTLVIGKVSTYQTFDLP